MLNTKARLDDDNSIKRNYNWFKVGYNPSDRVITSFELDERKVADAMLLTGFFANVNKDDANISDGEKTPESIDEQDNAPGMQQDQNNNKDNNTKQDPQKDMNAKDAKDVKNKDNTNTPKAQVLQPNQGDKKAPIPAPAPQFLYLNTNGRRFLAVGAR